MRKLLPDVTVERTLDPEVVGGRGLPGQGGLVDRPSALQIDLEPALRRERRALAQRRPARRGVAVVRVDRSQARVVLRVGHDRPAQREVLGSGRDGRGARDGVVGVHLELPDRHAVLSVGALDGLHPHVARLLVDDDHVGRAVAAGTGRDVRVIPCGAVVRHLDLVLTRVRRLPPQPDQLDRPHGTQVDLGPGGVGEVGAPAGLHAAVGDVPRRTGRGARDRDRLAEREVHARVDLELSHLETVTVRAVEHEQPDVGGERLADVQAHQPTGAVLHEPQIGPGDAVQRGLQQVPLGEVLAPVHGDAGHERTRIEPLGQPRGAVSVRPPRGRRVTVPGETRAVTGLGAARRVGRRGAVRVDERGRDGLAEVRARAETEGRVRGPVRVDERHVDDETGLARVREAHDGNVTGLVQDEDARLGHLEGPPLAQVERPGRVEGRHRPLQPTVPHGLHRGVVAQHLDGGRSGVGLDLRGRRGGQDDVLVARRARLHTVVEVEREGVATDRVLTDPAPRLGLVRHVHACGGGEDVTDLVVVGPGGTVDGRGVRARSHDLAVDGGVLRRDGLVHGRVHRGVRRGLDAGTQGDHLVVEVVVALAPLRRRAVEAVHAHAVRAVRHASREAAAVTRPTVRPARLLPEVGRGHTRVVEPVEGRPEVEVLPVGDLDRRGTGRVPDDLVAELGPEGGAILATDGTARVQPGEDSVVLPQVRGELGAPEVLVPRHPVGSRPPVDAIGEGSVGGRVERVRTGHALQRVQELRGVARDPVDRLGLAVVQVEHPDLTTDHPPRAADDVEGDRVEVLTREPETCPPGDVRPERHVGEQGHAVALAVELGTVGPEARVGLNGLLHRPRAVHRHRLDHGVEPGGDLVEVVGRHGLEEVVGRTPGAVGAHRVEPAGVVPEAHVEGVLVQHVTQEHREPAHRHRLADLGLPPVGVARVRHVPVPQRPLDAGHERRVLEALGSRVTVGVRHGEHPVERDVRRPHGAVRRARPVRVVDVGPRPVRLLGLRVLERFRGAGQEDAVRDDDLVALVQVVVPEPRDDGVHVLGRRGRCGG